MQKLRQYLLDIGVAYRIKLERCGRYSIYDQEDMRIYKIILRVRGTPTRRPFRVTIPERLERLPNIWEVFEQLCLLEPPALNIYLEREGYALNARYGAWKHQRMCTLFNRICVIFTEDQRREIVKLLEEYRHETK